MTENIENSFIGAAPEPWLVGVRRPLRSEPLSAGRLTLSFSSAAARLAGPRQGLLPRHRGAHAAASPRAIVSALVLGSRGDVTVSGPELAGDGSGLDEHVGLLQRPRRHRRDAGAGPQRPSRRRHLRARPTPAPAPASAPSARREAPAPRAAAPTSGRARGRRRRGRLECRPARAGLARSRPLEHPSGCRPTTRVSSTAVDQPSNAPSQLLGPPSHPLALICLAGLLTFAACAAGRGGRARTATPEQIAWVRRAASNFVTAELGGNGARRMRRCSPRRCAPAPARGTCEQRWDASLAGMLHDPHVRAALHADLRASPARRCVVHGGSASIALPAPLLERAQPFRVDAKTAGCSWAESP